MTSAHSICSLDSVLEEFLVFHANRDIFHIVSDVLQVFLHLVISDTTKPEMRVRCRATRATYLLF